MIDWFILKLLACPELFGSGKEPGRVIRNSDYVPGALAGSGKWWMMRMIDL
jgi:hypothetical protein